jgi:hypothetical protein
MAGLVKHIASNTGETLLGLPVLNKLRPQGGGVGIKSNFNGMKQSHKDMAEANRVLKSGNETEKRLTAMRDKAMKDGNTNDVTMANNMLSQMKNERSMYEGTRDAATKSTADSMNDMVKGVGRYFGATDMRGQSGRFMTGAVRNGAAVGGVMAAGTGLRYLSGGGMTYNNQGQRDIAGIPFI